MNEPVHHTSANVLVRVPVKIVAINDQNTKTKNNRIQFTHQATQMCGENGSNVIANHFEFLVITQPSNVAR